MAVSRRRSTPTRASTTRSGRRCARRPGFRSWEAQLPTGFLGENLTLAGLLEAQAWVGDVLRFADCELAVSEPRYPCFKFNAAMGFNQAGKLMAQSGWCGMYLAVRAPGTLRAGESFTLLPGPREVGIAELFRSKMSRQSAPRAIAWRLQSHEDRPDPERPEPEPACRAASMRALARREAGGCARTPALTRQSPRAASTHARHARRRRVERRRLYACFGRPSRRDQGRRRAGDRTAHLQRAFPRTVSSPLPYLAPWRAA